MKKLICTALSLILLTSCSHSKSFDEKDLIGTWTRSADGAEATWIFDEDGKCSQDTRADDGDKTVTVSTRAKYELDGKKLKLEFTEYGTKAEYTVTISDGVMTCSDGQTTYRFEKK